MNWLWWALLFHSAAIPVAISLSEGSGFALAVAGVLCLIKTRNEPRPVPVSVALPIVLFIVYAVVMSVSGLQPAGSYHKLYRFLAFGVVAALPLVVASRPDGRQGLQQVLGAYLVGMMVLGLTDLVRIPLQLSQGVSLFDTGNMRDPQFYMVAILLTVGSGVFVLRDQRRVGWAATAFFAAGLVFQFKRGAWIATMVSLTGLSLLKKKWSVLLAIALAAGLAVLFPPTRERISQLRDVTELNQGGRYALWTEVAPRLVQDHPWGVGFKQSSYKLLRSYSYHIQPGLDHLHNNILQIQVELGWMGVLLWVWIQVAMLHLMIGVLRTSARLGDDAARNLGVGLLSAFVALHLNGMVEYNFGDTEILFLFTWIMGLSVALHRHVVSLDASA